MAKRRESRRAKSASRRKPAKSTARSAKRPIRRAARASARKRSKVKVAKKGPVKSPKLSRARRTLQDVVPTPPSSLNMNRRGTAARTGRMELDQSIEEHGDMTPALTGGDVDADRSEEHTSELQSR